MAPGLELNLLLLFFLLFVTRVWPEEPKPLEVAGAVGGVAFLNPRNSQNPKEYSQIHWRWGTKLKIAGWKLGGKAEYPKSRFRGRLELFQNHTLKISHLELGDGGNFFLYLEDQVGKEDVERVLLSVYDLVPKPNVMATTNGNPRRCNATLSCSVALEGVTYEWITPQKLSAEDSSVLSVSFDPEVQTYVCKVSNPVSTNNASLTYRHPCSWTGAATEGTQLQERASSIASHPIPATLGHLILLILLFLLLPMA